MYSFLNMSELSDTGADKKHFISRSVSNYYNNNK